MSHHPPSPLRVIIPFAQMKTGDQVNPNLAGVNPVDKYFACMVVAFASVKRTTPDAELILMSNAPIPAAYKPALDQLGVREVIREFTHRPPAGFVDSFQASLYYLDAIETLDERPTVLLDPDVVVVRDLNALVEDLGGRCGAYPLRVPARHNYNGISRLSATQAHARLDGDTSIPLYFGGEIYIFQGPAVRTIQERVKRAWEGSLADFAAGRDDYLRTEEHIINYALHRQDIAYIDHAARRIWTARSLRATAADDIDLTVWHLPAEKDKGFARVRPAVEDLTSWFWTTPVDAWRRELHERIGLGRRSPARLAIDFVAHSRRRLREIPVPVFERTGSHS